MGTMLQKTVLRPGAQPELVTLRDPPRRVHPLCLAEAGARVICANTFGANALNCPEAGTAWKEVIAAAAKQSVRVRVPQARVALDLGPLGELLEPSGTLSFERAYELYAQAAQVRRQARTWC